MKKAKAKAKNLFRGLGSSKSGPEARTSGDAQRSDLTAKLTVPLSTAPRSRAASVSGHDNVASQTSTGAVTNSDEQRIGDTAVQPESQPRTSNPRSPSPAATLLTSAVQAPKSPLKTGNERIIVPSRISRSLTELDVAMTEFRENYELFATKNSHVLLIDNQLNTTFHNAEASDDIRRSAQIFGDGIWAILQTMETKENSGKSGWLTKLGNFLTRLYPVAMLSLNLAAAIAEVSPWPL